MVAADGSTEKAWALANRSVRSLQDLLNAMPLIADPGLRASLYPRVLPLLDALPEALSPGGPKRKGTYGRYVRVELPRKGTLTLAEVEVFSDGRNVARRGKATQKNTGFGGDASRAIDGNTNPSYGAGGQTHTLEETDHPWWEVDLGSEVPIDRVAVYNRGEGFESRLNGFTLQVLDGGRNVVFERKGQPGQSDRLAIEVGGGGPEGAVRRAAMTALTSVRGQEGPTFKALARFVESGEDRAAAVRAVQRIPAAYWPADGAKPLLDSLIAYVRTVPTADRTSPAALDALQLADGLAALLPRDQGRQARKALGDLGVRVIRLGTVLDQMLFDRDRIVVQAGKPVEVVFENNDLMPHNFVVTRPGSLEGVGLLAEETATQPGALERDYVPRTDRVLFHTRLIQPRETDRLDFDAPGKPGVYPYVCTYPGHWRRMYGALYVVDDLEDYQADPESYLARHPMPVADELLKSNRPRKEWTLADLAPAVEALKSGRSYSNGKQMFQVATCAACHRLNGVGEEFGPDLSKLDPKMTPVEVLRNVLEPSLKIDDKYRTFVFELNTGKVVTGMVIGETADSIKVIENPLAASSARVLLKSEVVDRAQSPSSIMPRGLLDKLTKDEILDLLSYVIARGDASNPLFHLGSGPGSGGHHHGAGH